MNDTITPRTAGKAVEQEAREIVGHARRMGLTLARGDYIKADECTACAVGARLAGLLGSPRDAEALVDGYGNDDDAPCDSFDYSRPDAADVRCPACNADGMNRTGLLFFRFLGPKTTIGAPVSCPNHCVNGPIGTHEQGGGM